MIDIMVEKDQGGIRETKLRLVYRNCSVCGSNDTTLVGKGGDFEYRTSPDIFFAVRCNCCGLIYLNPRPVLSDIQKTYPPNYHAYHFSKRNFGFVHTVRSWLDTRRLLDYCHNIADDANILDVGCGDGFHLGLLRKFGKRTWNLEGIDISKQAVDRALGSGFRVHLGTVGEVNLPLEHYDLILLIMTLEHLERPDQVLSAIYKLLKNGGRVVIVTDNTDTVDFKFFRKCYWGGYHFPRHLNLFDRHSVSKLAEKVGFDVDHLTTIVSPVNWIYSIHNRMVARNSPKWLINFFTLRSPIALGIFTILDFILQKFGKGAVLQATLRKPN